MPSKGYDLRPDDVIRFVNPVKSKLVHDGMKVRDAKRELILAHMRAGNVEIVRGGEAVALTKPSNVVTIRENKSATKARRCMTCSSAFQSFGPGNRMCPRCRHENNEW